MLRRTSLIVAAVGALATVPAAAAQAAFVTIEPLDSAPNGLTATSNREIAVVEPAARKVAFFGGERRDIALPGDPNAAASAASIAGNVWVTLSTGAQRGIAKVIYNSASFVSTGGFGCGPAGIEAEVARDRLLFTAPDPGTGCGTHGMGAIGSDGTGQIADTTVPNAYDLLAAAGKVFVPSFDDDTVRRYDAGPASFGPEATVSLPAGSQPDGIALGADGQVWTTLYGSGQVAKFPLAAGSLTQPTIVASGLAQPFGLAAADDGSTWVASGGDGRMVRVDAHGTQESVALPAGFSPWQVAYRSEGGLGGEIWVTDKDHPQVAWIVDGWPWYSGRRGARAERPRLDRDRLARRVARLRGGRRARSARPRPRPTTRSSSRRG